MIHGIRLPQRQFPNVRRERQVEVSVYCHQRALCLASRTLARVPQGMRGGAQ